MMGNKLAIAILVLFITIIGLPVGALGLRCASGVNQLQMELYEKRQQEYVQRYGSVEGFTSSDPRDDPNVDPVTCRVPLWSDFIGYPYMYNKRVEVKNAAVGVLVGTLVLDGLVIGAYLLFGKRPKQTAQNEQDHTHIAESNS